MRRHNIFNINDRYVFLRLFLFLDLLFIRNAAVSLQVRQVNEADIRESLAVIKIVHIAIRISRIIQHSLIVKLTNGIHRLVHTIIADADMIGQLKHFTRLTLRPPANEADFLIIIFLLVLRTTAFLLLVQQFFLLFFNITQLPEIPGAFILFIFIVSFIIAHICTHTLPLLIRRTHFWKMPDRALFRE